MLRPTRLPTLLLILSVFLSTECFVHAQDTGSATTDREALVALYNATDGTNWRNNTNWLSDKPLYTWYGVDTGGGRVEFLHLNENNLRGTIPAALGNLSGLLSLRIDSNELTGAIPATLVNLKSLKALRAGLNFGLSGSLPSGLAALENLAYVDLHGTQVCVPTDSAFQAWLSTIRFDSSGLTCGPDGPEPSGPTCRTGPSGRTAIDVAVFYTPTAREAAGGKSQIEANIELMVHETNRAYEQNGVQQCVELVVVEEVSYQESGVTLNDLTRFEHPSDGYLDSVHTIRDRVGADLVHLIVGKLNACGTARAFDVRADRAFSLTRYGCGSIPFAHELGHSMGLRHDRYVECRSDNCDRGAYLYSYGYVNQRAFEPGAPESARWRTIMAYRDQCTDAGFDCSLLARFSNPRMTYNGDPLGVPGDRVTPDVDGPADAVRTLNNTRHSVASFRPRVPQPPTFPSVTTSLSVAENTPANVDIGTPVAAMGGESDTLTYSLSGTDAASFDVDSSNGQITVGAGTVLDYETKTEYRVTVSVHDGTPDATVDDTTAVTITVTDVNEPPTFTESPSPSRTIAENATGKIGPPIRATDPDTSTSAYRNLTYTLAGRDAGSFIFEASTGQLRTRTALDYETKDRYHITVHVSDGKDANGNLDPTVDDSIDVTIIVTDIDESGSLTLPPQPLVNVAFTATLHDPDQPLTNVTWQWARSRTRSDWVNITGATAATYMPVDEDEGYYLRVQVSYTGVFGTSKSLRTISNQVEKRETNEPPAFEGGTTTSRTIVENTATGRPIGLPLTATDPDPADTHALTYALRGSEAAAFAINERTGQLKTKAALDYETKAAYTFTVTVTDPAQATASITVTIFVTDAPGTVTLSSPRPQVGRVLTAQLSDPDGVADLTWYWERSEQRTIWSQIYGVDTATYTPNADDIDHYLRATAVYTDGHRTSSKEAMRATTGSVSSTCTEDDLHGNSATQATGIALATETAGAICPSDDYDYFTVTAPGWGLVFVETTGGANIRGTLWQNDVILASGPTDRQQGHWLGARVQAGQVVVAVQGQGGATGAYELTTTFVRGYLENPGHHSFQSGVGVLSGWVCEADAVELEIGHLGWQVAAYGTERLDTVYTEAGEELCGDTDNGFGLLFNWNRLGDGEHTVVALVDGVELGRATVTVTTLGQKFVEDAAGECLVEDFPYPGQQVTLEWQQNQQNFVIASGSRPGGVHRAGTVGVGYLGNPGGNSFQSGIGVISGWVCDAETVEIEIAPETGEVKRYAASYGTERLDTAPYCGDTDNGFGLLFNWNRLGAGEHTVIALVDGAELGRAVVRVTTVGEGAEEEFLRGAEGECMVEDFPDPGQQVTLEWQQNSQNFVITDVE